jgi:hypothetical protein
MHSAVWRGGEHDHALVQFLTKNMAALLSKTTIPELRLRELSFELVALA